MDLLLRSAVSLICRRLTSTCDALRSSLQWTAAGMSGPTSPPNGVRGFLFSRRGRACDGVGVDDEVGGFLPDAARRMSIQILRAGSSSTLTLTPPSSSSSPFAEAAFPRRLARRCGTRGEAGGNSGVCGGNGEPTVLTERSGVSWLCFASRRMFNMLLVVPAPPLAILRRGLPVLVPVLGLGDEILAITSCARRGPQCAATMGKRALPVGTGRGGDQIDGGL